MVERVALLFTLEFNGQHVAISAGPNHGSQRTATVSDVNAQVLGGRTDVVVIGGGQAGLSAGYYLHRFGLGDRTVMLDHSPGLAAHGSFVGRH